MRRFAVCFLLAEGLGGLAWWVMLLAFPGTRGAFFPASADYLVFSLLLSDVTLFDLSALAAAWALVARRDWAAPVLWIHTGAVLYAGLFAFSLTAVTGAGSLGVVLMAPSIAVVPYLAWHFRKEDTPKGEQ